MNSRQCVLDKGCAHCEKACELTEIEYGVSKFYVEYTNNVVKRFLDQGWLCCPRCLSQNDLCALCYMPMTDAPIELAHCAVPFSGFMEVKGTKDGVIVHDYICAVCQQSPDLGCQLAKVFGDDWKKV